MAEIAFLWTGRLGAGWLAAHGYVRAASDGGWKRTLLPGAWAFLGAWLGLWHLVFVFVRQDFYPLESSYRLSLDGIGGLLFFIFFLALLSSVIAVLTAALTYRVAGTRSVWARALCVGISTTALSPWLFEVLALTLWP